MQFEPGLPARTVDRGSGSATAALWLRPDPCPGPALSLRMWAGWPAASLNENSSPGTQDASDPWTRDVLFFATSPWPRAVQIQPPSGSLPG